MKAIRPLTAIHTVASVTRDRRRLDRQRRAVSRALDAMRQSATLHLRHEPNRPRWLLSNGWPVPEDVAAILINHPNVIGVGDSLYAGARSQTWRYCSHKGD